MPYPLFDRLPDGDKQNKNSLFNRMHFGVRPPKTMRTQPALTVFN